MRLEQTRVILQQIQKFHEDMALTYHNRSAAAESTRVRMLLDYLGGRHTDLAFGVANFQRHAPNSALEAYTHFEHDIRDLRQRLRRALERTWDIDEITGIAMEVTDKFLDAFQRASGKAGDEALREVFQSLVAGTERERRKLARNANLLMDL
ncbi:MAG: hypothetical protein OEU49_07235 [Chromatiales bacterium]|jgi:hypothetical protein|nr:hypothetical protein [Chromatiales bacterium]